MECPNSDYLSEIDADMSGKKIGVLRQMMGDGVSAKVVSAADDAVKKFQDLGAICNDVHLETVPHSVAAYYTITSAEAASNLARYDNIRYGFEMPQSGYIFDAYISEARRRMGPEVKRRMILGGFVPSAGYAGKYYLKALKVKSRLSKEIAQAFKKFYNDDALTDDITGMIDNGSDDSVKEMLLKKQALFKELDGYLTEIYRTSDVLIDDAKLVTGEEGFLCTFDIERINDDRSRDGLFDFTEITAEHKDSIVQALDEFSAAMQM